MERVIGIDLGTTNSALAFTGNEEAPVAMFGIPQLANCF